MPSAAVMEPKDSYPRWMTSLGWDRDRSTPWVLRFRGSTHSARMTGVRSLLLVVHVHVLSVDHAFIFLLTAAVRTRRRTGPIGRRAARPRSRRSLRLRCLIHFLGQLVRSLGQVLAGLIHLRLVVRVQRLLDVVDHAVELILGFNRVTLRLVLGCMRVGFLRHALDLFLRQTRRRRN